MESQLEEEKRRTQRERMTVTKLQNKLIKVCIRVFFYLQKDNLTDMEPNKSQVISKTTKIFGVIGLETIKDFTITDICVFGVFQI